MIAQVIAMSPDDINRLPPTERANVLQLVRLFLTSVYII
jgi:hypothetical protein